MPTLIAESWATDELINDQPLIQNIREVNNRIYGDFEVALEFKRGLLALSRGNATSSSRKLIGETISAEPKDGTKFIAKYRRSGQIREIVKGNN